MDIMSLIIQLVSGAIGGNVAGSILKNLNLGTLGNTLAGIVGGGIGTHFLESGLGVARMASDAGLDPGQVITQLAGGGVGGGVMMVLMGLVKQAFSK